MKKLSSVLCALVCMLGASSSAFATDAIPSNKVEVSADIDDILSQLAQQNNQMQPLPLFNHKTFGSSSSSSLLATNSSLIHPDTSNLASFSSNATDNDDMLSHLTLVASNTVKRFKQTGRASWYGGKFHGRKTASGERFNMNAMTAAHKSLPFNTYLKVTNKLNGKSVIVKVNDRGPFTGNRILDLSYGAAKKIGLVKPGVANVSIEKVSAP